MNGILRRRLEALEAARAERVFVVTARSDREADHKVAALMATGRATEADLIVRIMTFYEPRP